MVNCEEKNQLSELDDYRVFLNFVSYEWRCHWFLWAVKTNLNVVQAQGLGLAGNINYIHKSWTGIQINFWPLVHPCTNDKQKMNDRQMTNEFRMING